MSYVEELRRQIATAENKQREMDAIGSRFLEEVGGFTHNGVPFPEHLDCHLESAVDMIGADCDKDVYSIPVLTPDFCDAISAHISKYREFKSKYGRDSGGKTVDLRQVPGLSFVDDFLYTGSRRPSGWTKGP
ncbi:hypothetical protein TrRE_jg877 [Triparma retinervis]|uniref:Uncharacterized protein n=1 Tax=Triparma retinervis TaxID=2557542 RepID=A0A9W7AEU3_9STRA|nr:hypothetical protein TrRE_jg877 [Triparma retinervis]